MDELAELSRFRAELGVPDAARRLRVLTRTEELLLERTQARRRFAMRPLVILLAAVALAAFVALAAEAGGLLDVFGVERQPNEAVPRIDGAQPVYVLGDKLFGARGGPQRLGELASGESAWAGAVPAGDESAKLVYEATNAGGQPGRALRIHDLDSGLDEELVPDAFAPAWRADGVLAYGKTVKRHTRGGDIGAVFPARVEVRRTALGPAVTWIAPPGAYVPVAWAGQRLLVEQLGDDGAAFLLALDRPGELERLATGWLEALSPDGRLALVAEGAALGRPTGPLLRLVDTRTGAVRAELDLRRASVTGASWGALAAAGPGDWAGQRIVLPAGAGVLVLSASAHTLEIEKLARFAGDASMRGAEYHEARFLDPGGRRIVVKADVLAPGASSGRSLQSALVCSLDRDACVRGGDAVSSSHPLGLVTNPSRPLPARSEGR
jgi:hypothetical protein